MGFTANTVTLLAAALLAMGLAVFALTRNVKKGLNRACFGLFGCLAVSHVGWAMLPSPYGLSLWVVAEGWMPAALSLFCHQIGRGASSQTTLFRAIRYGAVAFGLIATAAALFPEGLLQITADVGLQLSPTVAWGLVICLLLHVAALLKIENLFRAIDGELRWRLKYLLLGCVALVAIRLYTLTLTTLYQSVDPHLGTELAVATLVGGAMVAYALVRHRLLDVDVFISRYVIYNSLTLAAVGSYLMVVGIVVYGLQRAGDQVPAALISAIVFLALTALGIGLLSDTLRWRLRHFVDRHFYKNRHDYRREWRAVTQAVAAEHTVDGFVSALGRMVTDTLGAQYVVTLIKERGTNRCLAPADAQGSTDISPLQEDELEPDFSPAWGSGDDHVAVHRHRSRHDQVLFLPILSDEERVGWVALGPRVGLIPYHMEDLELVCDMAAQTAVAIHNLRLGEELAESREQTALHQLSTFFIHDMKNTTNSLGMLAQNIPRNRSNPEFWDAAADDITRAVAQMNVLMARLKELREDTPTDTQPIDLGALIDDATDRWSQVTTAELTTEIAPALVCIGNETLLDSVLTNLIVNATEAGAERITVSAWRQDTMVVISVTDDGAGMERAFIDQELFKPFTSTKQQGMGIGLFQSRRGIEQLGGSLTVESQKGRGSCFTITIPSVGNPTGDDTTDR